jgi:hypothetical protein
MHRMNLPSDAWARMLFDTNMGMSKLLEGLSVGNDMTDLACTLARMCILI